MPRVLFRVLRDATPTAEDFLSQAAQGRRFRSMNPEVGRNWDALSMFEEEDQARKKAIERPRLGHYIAEVEIPENAPITCERTTTSEGHYSVRGDPELLLRCVVRVVPVRI